MLAKKVILVTGATGFTGGHLAQRLAMNGDRVRALVRNPKKGQELQRLGIEIAIGDLRDPNSLRGAMDGVSIVYHIAGAFRQESISADEMWETNVTGTRNLLEVSQATRVKRFIHCSTIGVHGDIKEPPGTEVSPYAPGDRYQESKAEGEKLALRYASEGRLPVVVFRPGGIYGPGDMRFHKLFRAIQRRRFVMLGTGEVQYQLIYIDDLIDGILLCGTEDSATGRVYILTGDAPVTLNALCRKIASVLGVSLLPIRIPVEPVYALGYVTEMLCRPLGIEPPLYRRRVDFFRKNRAFSIERAKQELGFQPQVSLRNGLETTANWYKEKDLL